MISPMSQTWWGQSNLLQHIPELLPRHGIVSLILLLKQITPCFIQFGFTQYNRTSSPSLAVVDKVNLDRKSRAKTRRSRNIDPS